MFAMPIHDWSRVSAGTFHHFHCYWITDIGKALNNGLLPSGYYAMAEQSSASVWPDVLTLQTEGDGSAPDDEKGTHGTALAVAPPKVRFTAKAEMDAYAKKRRTLVIRHASGDRIIALLEILSPGNKSSRHEFQAFLNKALAALAQGIHLSVVDLHPTTRRDPQGIHGALWEQVSDEPYKAPAAKSLTLAAHSAGSDITAFVEPVAVGDKLPDLPLFLLPNYHVVVPLESAYLSSFQGVPQRWRTVLEA